MQPRTLDVDLDFAISLRRRGDRNVLFVQMEQREKLDEVALDEAHAPQIIELVVGEAQIAQLAHFVANLIDIRHEIDILGPAAEAVFHARGREMMQNDLHHRELVQISIEQRSNNHDGANRTAAITEGPNGEPMRLRHAPARRPYACYPNAHTGMARAGCPGTIN